MLTVVGCTLNVSNEMYWCVQRCQREQHKEADLHMKTCFLKIKLKM